MEQVYSPPANVPLSTHARRRARTTRRQLQILEQFFNGQTAYPNKKQKQQLAQLVGFTEESVHFWFQNHRQAMRTRQQQNKPSSSSADQGTSTVITATNTTTTTVASTTMIDPVTEHRTQMPSTVSSPSYANMLEPSSSLSHMQVHSSRQQAFSFSNQTHPSLQVPTHAARLPPFSSFVQDQTHITAPAMPPRLPSSSYFSAFTPTSAIQQHHYHPAIMAANGAIGDDARVLPAPGTARLPPIPFYFHHPEFGMESTMLQLSSFGRADQSSG